MHKKIMAKPGGILQVKSTVQNKWIDCQIVDVKSLGISFIYEDASGTKSIANISAQKLQTEPQFYRVVK